MASRAALGCLLIGFVLSGPGASAEIYRWTDAEGRVHFTQDLGEVPPSQRDDARAERRGPSRLQTYSSPRPPPRRRYPQVLSLPFERRGTMMLVQARLNDRVTAPFIVDTGASDVSIPADVAEQAGIAIGPDTPRVVYQTAGGPVSSPVVTLDSIEAGEARVEHVRAHVNHAMSFGLLGGAFFNNFTVHIDPASNVIRLSPNERVRGGIVEAQWRERFQQARGRLQELERYMADHHFSRESRVASLERRRAALEAALEALEEEADALGVPHAWRD